MLEQVHVQCCIAGGGPAGMMLGFLLARAGVRVLILEKHRDFLRDFRGDTVHPSTLELMHELGILEELLKRPHQKITQLRGQIGSETVTIADFSRLPLECKFVALMPQWDFLDFLAEQGRRYAGFHVRMEADVRELVQERERYGAQVRGIRAATPQGDLEVRADLVVGADGRNSTLRQKANLKVEKLGAPMDVIWMRIPRHPSDPDQSIGAVARGRMFVRLNRGDYWQCAYLIPKGALAQVQAQGLDTFRREIGALAPFLEDRLDDLDRWDDVKLLTVEVDRLERWYRNGLLMIGDAAHAMSPIGGVGINLAIQDAVATANLLAVRLLRGIVSTADLRKIQHRRELPTRLTQVAQIFLQNRVIQPILAGKIDPQVPWQVRLLNRLPSLQRVTGRFIGIGVRPEHVQTGSVKPAP